METPKRPAVFIEKIFPVKLLNEQVYYEHGGNPFKGLHRWYSRKPLSFSRASVLGSILPADISMEEFEYLLGLFSEQEFEFWQKQQLSKEELEKKRHGGQVKLYKTPPTAKQMERVHDLCERVWGKRTPAILDPFAGGGSIPFEAARYGLEVFASDLNPVAVVTMKAAIAFPLKFGPSLQADIDRWVKWVGDEAEKRLAEFFPCPEGETVQNYLWAHTVVCPSCQSVIPLSPNWWLDKSPGSEKKEKICAVKPIPNLKEKKVDFELIIGSKGKGSTIQIGSYNFDPASYNTISRGIGKCINCGIVIENEYICSPSKSSKLEHQVYATVYRKSKGTLEFRIPNECDFLGIKKAQNEIKNKYEKWELQNLISHEETPVNPQYSMIRNYGINEWHQCFNDRQILTLITYVEIINEAKCKLQAEYESEKVEAISTYLTLVLDRCVDLNSKLSHWDAGHPLYRRASTQHALNLFWCYPETTGSWRLWQKCGEAVASEYFPLCQLLDLYEDPQQIFTRQSSIPGTVKITLESADNLYHISDNSLDAVITDPPYYGTIPYADISDFFYVWQKRVLGDIFPDLLS